VSNYVEAETIENIHKMRRKQTSVGRGAKPPKAPRGDENNNADHVARIKKMKELYGLFVKMEQGQVEDPAQVPVDLKLPEVEMSPQRFKELDNTLPKNFGAHGGPNKVKLPEISP
jgi:hypothetical protein